LIKISAEMSHDPGKKLLVFDGAMVL